MSYSKLASPVVTTVPTPDYNRMDPVPFKTLRIYVAFAAARSLKSVAKQFHQSPEEVITTLLELENTVGVPLYVYDENEPEMTESGLRVPVELTEAGWMVCGKFWATLQKMDQLLLSLEKQGAKQTSNTAKTHAERAKAKEAPTDAPQAGSAVLVDGVAWTKQA